MPAGRERGGAGTVLHDNKIYLVGGNTNGHWNGFVPWVDVLDLRSGEWTALPDAPHARDHFQAALVDGRIVAAGGRRSYAETKQTFNLTVPEVDVFDIVSGQWSTLSAPIPTPRAGCLAVARGGWAVVLGGESSSQPKAHAEVEALSLATGTWLALPSLIEGRHGTGAAFIGDTLYVAAGCAQRGGGAEIHSMERWPWRTPAP
jgi:N-acetylneuraminic acid mutarotase